MTPMGKHKLRCFTHSPTQQVAAVVATRDFLLRLTRPADTPRVPGPVRQEARSLLRHFPMEDRLRPILEAALLPVSPLGGGEMPVTGEVGGELCPIAPVIASDLSAKARAS